ncbi:signal peptide peptidase SppA [Rhizobium sp. RU20A]|nr:signal peptide peptidase SppA [Rhizobium sp. RU20A]
MKNALLASFNNEPALVNSAMHTQFEACLAEGQTALSRIETSSEKIVMQDDFWPSPDSWLAVYRPYIVKNGILMIPVKGVLLYGVGYAIGSWLTGYVYITKALERGLADPEVKGIAFVIDSPGGHVAGCFDLGDKIYAARGRKPMRAYAAENAYSAAYLIFSSADPGQATVSRTGGVGSIGVVTMHIDASKAMDDYGYKITFIHYGKHKVDGNAYEALPADVKKRIQARIDGLGELFVSTVARNRAMDAQAVRDTEALTFTAEEATSNGLADAIGSLDDAIAVFAADMSNQEEDDMSTKDTSAVDQAAVDTARAEGVAQGTEAGKREGALAERTRISAILDSEEGKKRPAAALAAALDTDMTADQTIKFMAKLPAEPSKSLSRAEVAMRDAGYAPRGAEESSAPAARPLSHPQRQLSKVEQALADAGYQPRLM